jgi:hypothetical protein
MSQPHDAHPHRANGEIAIVPLGRDLGGQTKPRAARQHPRGAPAPQASATTGPICLRRSAQRNQAEDFLCGLSFLKRKANQIDRKQNQRTKKSSPRNRPKAK